jgi:hypothetical protein
MHWHKSAFNFIAHGQKRWFLLPPQHAVYAAAPVAQWVVEVLGGGNEAAGDGGGGGGNATAAPGRDLSRLRAMHARYGRHVLECTQGPGDVAWVPSGWGHAVLNLHTTIGVAVEFSAALSRY